MKIWQDLSKFQMPRGFRGRSAVYVQLWWLAQRVLFNTSPQFAYAYRSAILRLFGAKVGRGVVIRPSVKITYPWKVSIGDHSWIGDDVVLYSLGSIEIGQSSVVSQGGYICAGDHDYRVVNFPIRARDISIGDQVWLAAGVFVCPGVSVGSGAVVGARSVVVSDVRPGSINVGNPARDIGSRCMVEESDVESQMSKD